MKKEIIKDLEKIIERIRQRTKYNDWASSSFLWDRADEIKEVMNKINKNEKNTKEELENEEEIELTCCGDEVTGWVEDYRICPTCKEHI